jgi:hypothetical protein
MHVTASHETFSRFRRGWMLISMLLNVENQ